MHSQQPLDCHREFEIAHAVDTLAQRALMLNFIIIFLVFIFPSQVLNLIVGCM